MDWLEQARLPSDLWTVVQGNTSFAMDLYHQLRQVEGNLFLSPYSISTALAMTYAGARGRTATQMARALHLKLDPEQLHPAFGGLQARLNDIERKGKVQLAVANSLWPMVGYALRDAFLDLTAGSYGAQVRALDYSRPEKARRTINTWVEEKTARKIAEVIPPGFLNDLTRLVLVNAIYFKGDWDLPFDLGSTLDLPFWVTPSLQVETPTMTQKHRFRYGETGDLQAVELPYAGDDLSMVVLLPRDRGGLAALEARLTPKNLDRWSESLREREIRVYLPRFETTSFFRIDDALRSLGMVDAFADGADFSGMDGTRLLYLSAALHKAYVATDEQGTEAAAATAALMVTLGFPAPVPEFRADHPFVFLIREKGTGSVLFIGRVTNPSKDRPQPPAPPKRRPGMGAQLARLRKT